MENLINGNITNINQIDKAKLEEAKTKYGVEAVEKAIRAKFNGDGTLKTIEQPATVDKPKQTTYVNTINPEGAKSYKEPTQQTNNVANNVVENNKQKNNVANNVAENNKQKNNRQANNNILSGNVDYNNVINNNRTIQNQQKQQKQQEQQKAIDISPEKLSESLNLLTQSGKTKDEAIAIIKNKYEKNGYNVDEFDNKYASLLSSYQGIDGSVDELYKTLNTGGEINSYVQKNSPQYKVAKQMYDEINTLDKSEEGIYIAIKNGSLSDRTIAELRKNPVYKEMVDNATKKVVEKNFSGTENVKELLKKSPEELKDYTLGLFSSFGENIDYADQLNSNEDVQKYKDGYLKSTEDYLKTQAKLSTLKNDIRNRYPNATEGFINALYNRESGALQQQAAEQLAEINVNKGGYDLIVGEIDRNNALQTAQADKQLAYYNNIFNAQLGEQIKENDLDRALKEIEKSATLAGNYSLNTLGNGIAVSFNKKTGKYEIIDVNNVPKGENVELANKTIINDKGLDFSISSIIDKYPNEASIKNNNPAGLSSHTSNALQNMLNDAGIKWKVGTERPQSEGGNYLSFETVQDGLKAYEIALTERGSSNIFNRLKSWVGTTNDKTNEKYAEDILNKAGISGWRQRVVTWDNITEAEKDAIMTAQIERESPGFAQELKNNGIITKGGTFDFDAGITKGQKTIKEKINGVEMVLGGLGVPIDYERTIKSQITTQLLNSDKELAAANEVIKIMYNNGITDSGQASAIFQGFKINNINDLAYGGSLLKWTRGLTDKSEGLLANLSQSINSGNYGGAALLLEDNYYKNIKAIEGDRLYTRNQGKEDISRVEDLKEYINELGNDYPGIVQGTFENLLGRLKPSEIEKLKGKMARLNTNEKIALFGTNQTEAESDSFQPLEFLSNDKLSTLLGKIDNKENDILLKVNAYRDGRMPKLTIDELNDGIDGVVRAYKNSFIKGGTKTNSDADEFNSVFDSGKIN